MASDPFLDQAIARVGTAINAKWTLDALLGSGGMATVYAATHRNGSRAALKVLHAELARDSAIRERFLREGRIANKIDHPSVVQIIDDDVSDQGEVFLVMELLEGETLDAYMRRKGGKLSVEEAFRIFDPVLDLLAKAHEAGIVHRDIKPENVFLTKSGTIKVLDFGIARFREHRAEATRQGTALGTPSFMAPEQALGLGHLVDGRADLFSVGACIYTALTGTRLHEGRAENEAFVLAATKAAPSIANAAPELPVEIVAFVDKALAYERNSRFPDAATMRAEMRTLLAALQAGRLTTLAKRQGGLVVKREGLDEEDAPATAESKNDLIRRMKNVWKLLGMFVASTRQYGWDHPESGRHLQAAFNEATDALAHHPDGVRWEVTPYAFLYDGNPIWEPERPPFDRMPFQLFADGLRKVQLKPGITEQELRDLVAVLLRDPASSTTAAEDDTITSLWDRHFPHVAYLAIDSFAEGDAEDRDAFEKECANLAKEAIELAQITKDWDENSLETHAQQMNLAAAMQGAAESAAALALDPSTRAALSAQLAQSADRWTERYVEAFAYGYLESEKLGSVEPVAAALREWAADQVTLRNYPIVFRMFSAMAGTLRLLDPERADQHERGIALAMFPANVLRTIISKLSEQPQHRDSEEGNTIDASLAESIEHVLGLIAQGSLIPLACERLDAARGAPLGEVLLRYVKRWARGNEETIASKLDSYSPDTAIELVQVLAETATPAAIEALLVAFRSPHVQVRVEALARLPDGSSDKVAREVLALLDDPEAAVREEALRVVGKFKLKSIGPEIVRFIGSPAFHSRSVDERKAWLQTLASLNPARAESLAVEMLTTWTFVPKPEHEKTRVAAAEALAAFGSRHVVDAIRTATKKRWWNTPPVREAAERALQAISERTSAASTSRREGQA